jgi:1,4-dihydroxy-2-naphthoyl-CoA hydrolase
MADKFALPKRSDGSRTEPDRDAPAVPAARPAGRPAGPAAPPSPSGRIPIPPSSPGAAHGHDVDAEATRQAHAAMPFARLLGIEIIDASKEMVRSRMAWHEQLCTVNNGMHGGALMSLADTTGAFLAFYNLPQGAGTSTIESKTNFMRGVSSGSVVATSTPLHVGRTTIVVVTDITAPDGKLVARVTQTQAVIPAA